MDYIDPKVEELLKMPQYEQRTTEWYEQRKNAITASDIPTVLGENSYKTPWSLFLDKCNANEKPFVGNDATRWGNHYEDIAIEKEEVPQPNTMKFKAEGNAVSRIMEYASKCLSSYLEANPKINRIYDEIQDNLEFDGKGEYIEFMKSIIISYLGENWSVQQGSTKKSVLISR
jgi:hypothetical protein